MAVKTLQTVENALAVLEVVAELQPIGVSALARHMNMDKNTAQRILITLGASGWIQKQSKGSAWELTPRILTLSNRVAIDLRKDAHVQLEILTQQLRETALLWQLTYENDDIFATLLDKVDSGHDVKITMEVGRRTRALNESSGFVGVRSLIREFPNGEVAWLGGANDERQRYFLVTPGGDSSTITIGSLIYDGPGQAIAVISVVGPCERISPTCYETIGRKTAEAARLLSGI